MGASMSLAIKKNSHGVTVLGYDYPDVRKAALEKNVIDVAVSDWPEEASDVDLIFLCTPLNVIEEHLRQLSFVVDQQTIVTDIGSTKVKLYELVRKIGFQGIYVGGHPMTGAEKSGLAAANPLLYENAVYLLTNVDHDRKNRIESTLFPILNSIKARLMLLDAETHDKIMAAISHVPQVLAIALVNMIGEMEASEEPYFELAAGGFRDITRIASSSYSIWEDIIASNRIHVEETLEKLIAILSSYKRRLGNLSDEFESANLYRRQLPKVGKGFLSPLTDVLVYVDDQMGVIAKISNALSNRNIDIRDIELLKIREKEGGVFRLSFENRTQAEKAVEILKSIHYQAIIRE